MFLDPERLWGTNFLGAKAERPVPRLDPSLDIRSQANILKAIGDVEGANRLIAKARAARIAQLALASA